MIEKIILLFRSRKKSNLSNPKNRKSLEITISKIEAYRSKIKETPNNDYFKLKIKILKLIKKYIEGLEK